MVTLRISKEVVTLKGGVWQGASADLQDDLDAITTHTVQHPPHGYIPDLDKVIADEVVRRLHGRIVTYTPPSLPKGTVA